MRRLERELVLAHETGAAVSVVLTKADLAESEDEVERVRERVRALVGADVETLVVSEAMPESVEAVRARSCPRDNGGAYRTERRGQVEPGQPACWM